MPSLLFSCCRVEISEIEVPSVLYSSSMFFLFSAILDKKTSNIPLSSISIIKFFITSSISMPFISASILNKSIKPFSNALLSSQFPSSKNLFIFSTTSTIFPHLLRSSPVNTFCPIFLY